MVGGFLLGVGGHVRGHGVVPALLPRRVRSEHRRGHCTVLRLLVVLWVHPSMAHCMMCAL